MSDLVVTDFHRSSSPLGVTRMNKEQDDVYLKIGNLKVPPLRKQSKSIYTSRYEGSAFGGSHISASSNPREPSTAGLKMQDLDTEAKFINKNLTTLGRIFGILSNWRNE